jgi:indole-3-glycerol phosphate synthase
MSTQLQIIVANTRAEVMERRNVSNYALLERSAAAHEPRGFEAGLRRAAGARPAIIAELKKASPSRGLIRAAFDPATVARSLESSGAAALSVLTDQRFFQGSLDYLRQASEAVTIPCLRKDFIVDEFQIIEARAFGADAILLIVAVLDDAQLKSLRAEALRSQLDVLCEVHDHEELARAVDLGFTTIGVNSRNLHTMEVRPEIQIELGRLLPASAVRVAESGIRVHADLARMAQAGYTAFLIGESLMREADPGHALAALLQPEPIPALQRD